MKKTPLPNVLKQISKCNFTKFWYLVLNSEIHTNTVTGIALVLRLHYRYASPRIFIDQLSIHANFFSKPIRKLTSQK